MRFCLKNVDWVLQGRKELCVERDHACARGLGPIGCA